MKMSKLKSLNKDVQTKSYLKLLGKLEKLFKKFPKDKSFSIEDRKYLSCCLSELYFKSRHLNKVIKKISDTNFKIKNKSVDFLITSLIELQLGLYIGMLDWIKDLKKPLNSLIKAIEKSDPEKRTFIAEKSIHFSAKQVYSILRKIKYYYPAKKNKLRRKR